MKRLWKPPAMFRNNKGVAAIYVAIMLVVFIGIVALAFDIGYMMVSRNESQDAADAAALAGARKLGDNYYQGTNPVTDQVIAVAQNTAALNKVAGQNLAVDNVNTQIGTWDPPFNSTSPDPPNAVCVEVKREEGLTNGAINTFFAPVIGIDKVKSKATACAALSGPCNAKPTIPLGIGRSWFASVGANGGCTKIQVNATYSSCAGWTNLSTEKFQQQQVQGLLENPATMPMVGAGDIIGFGNGTVTPILTDLEALFSSTTYDIDNKTFNADGTVKDWTTTVVVFEDYNVCQPPTTPYKVLGFATVRIDSMVTTGNEKGINGEVQCPIVEEGRGGCFYAGTLGTIPNLVK